MAGRNTRSMHKNRREWLSGTAVALAAGMLACPLRAAQDNKQAAGAQAADKVQVTVRDVESEGQLIRVPVNKSIVVDFSAPVREVRLAKPEFAEVTAISPTQVLVTGKSFGTTQLITWFHDDTQRVFDVAVDIELERLMASIRTAAPRARVQAHALLNSVVLTGQAPDVESAERIMQIANVFSTNVINNIEVAGVQQVLLRVTVAEVNRSTTRQLGFNGFLAGDNLRDGFGLSNLDGLNPSDIGVPSDAPVTTNLPFVVGSDGIPVSPSTTLSVGFPRVQTQIFIRALHENGLLRILAEPNLVSMNGEEATFLAGGEIPIPIATQQQLRVQYKEFGIRLNFTPVVLSENRIRLKVLPEISEPDFAQSVSISGFTIPSFTTRRVETTVELGSGQTFAIGGLLNDRVRAVSRSVPGLGDVPILGTLFRSVDYQTAKTELVVLVTPELVAPISPDQITQVPGANYVIPNDFELFLEGKIEGEAGPALEPRVNNAWPVKPEELYGSDALRLRGPVGPTGGSDGS